MGKIVIKGMGVICSIAENTDELAKAIFNGKAGLKTEKFASGNKKFCLGKVGELERNDCLDRGVVLADKAIQQALKEEKKRDIGFINATSLGGIGIAESFLEKQFNGKRTNQSHLINYPIPALAQMLVKKYRITGPVVSFSTACTSFFVALGYAIELLHIGAINKALVCAIDPLCRQTVEGFKAIGACSNEPSKPFDTERNGLNLGEAAAAILLEHIDSHSSGFVEIAGYGLTNDGFHLSAPHPDGKGLRYAIELAMRYAKITPSEVDVIHAHGTGTKYSDAMELAVFEKIFSENVKPIPTFSTKGQTGHTLGPSGLIALIGGCIALREGFIPGTRNFGTCEIDLKNIKLAQNSIKCKELNNILITCSGFTGHNGALIAKKEG